MSLHRVSSHARRQPFDHLRAITVHTDFTMPAQRQQHIYYLKKYVLARELPSRWTWVTRSCCERIVYMKKAWAYNTIIGHWQEFLIWSWVSFFLQRHWSVELCTAVILYLNPEVTYTSLHEWQKQEIGRLKVGVTLYLPSNQLMHYLLTFSFCAFSSDHQP